MTDFKGIRSAVVTVGEELLNGKTLDSNGSWLSEKLTYLGAPVSGRWVTGDQPVAIKEAIITALTQAEVVIVTGGLGPTMDDLTRPSVAELFDRRLILEPRLIDGLHRHFSAMGYDDLPSQNLVQAEIPEGAIVISNDTGTAPGLILEEGGKSVVLLPGVPHEMRSMFDAQVADYINDRFRERLNPTLLRTYNTCGIPESLLAEKLAKSIADFPVDVFTAFLPGLEGVSIRVTTPDSDGEGLERLKLCRSLIMPVIAPYYCSTGKRDIVETLARILVEQGKTLAVGESCTGGLISKRITDYPGSSSFFKGGVVAYGSLTKSGILKIEESIMEEKGIVSEEVAALLAENSANLMEADFGIGLTGVAGPDGGTEDNPVGTICYSVVGHGKVRSFRKIFGGDRIAIRTRGSQAALFSLLQILTDKLD